MYTDFKLTMNYSRHFLTIGFFFTALTFVQAFVFNTILDALFADTRWLLVFIVSVIISIGSIYVYYLSHSTSDENIDRLYNSVGLWWGLLFNLFLGALGYWLIMFFTGTLGFALIPLMIAVAIFIYGLKKAQQVHIKKLQLSHPNFPADWDNKRLIFISDLHLGKTLNQDFLEKIVVAINEHQPEIVMIGGDLFDSTYADWSKVLAPLDNIDAEHVLYVTGNHEYYVNYETELRPHLEQFDIELLESNTININGLNIGGISHSLSDINFNFESEYKKLGFKPNQPNIFLYHEPVPKDSQFALNNHTTLQLSGHTHFGQIAPYNLITWITYGHFDYGLYQDPNTKSYQYTSSGTGTWGPPVRTTAKPEVVVIELQNS